MESIIVRGSPVELRLRRKLERPVGSTLRRIEKLSVARILAQAGFPLALSVGKLLQLHIDALA